MRDQILKSFVKLEQYCTIEKFSGWDPYDGLNSQVFSSMPVLSKNRITRLMWIQFMKKMPLNLRPIMKIKKDVNPKGLALFISAYSKLSCIETFRHDTISKIQTLVEQVMLLRSQGFSGSCWGYNFDWESRAFFQKKYTPTIVATSFVANSLIDAFEATQDRTYLNEAISSKEFILRDLRRTYDEDGDFAFSYSPLDETSVFNASLLGARLLSRIYWYTKDEELVHAAKNAVSYCCKYQNTDGSWFYSTLPFHQWIDNFHTGFNLECISEYGVYSGDKTFQSSFEKGLAYYLNTFFDENGRSKYYNNSLYPIDIHAPSQLVVTLAKADLFYANKQLIDRVLSWTIDNMQSPTGYFYFQKRKFYTNKIPYMRWSQAWIFYALAYYLHATQKANENLV